MLTNLTIYIETFIFGRRYQDGDGVAAMNNFLRSLSRFVVVRSGHDEGLGE